MLYVSKNYQICIKRSHSFIIIWVVCYHKFIYGDNKMGDFCDKYSFSYQNVMAIVSSPLTHCSYSVHNSKPQKCT